MNNFSINLSEMDLVACDVDLVLPIVIDLGFEDTEELMDIRVFDLMNMNMIDRSRAEGIIYCLYLYFNGNEDIDEEIQNGSIKQYFDYRKWRKGKPYDKVKVKDLILADKVNAPAIHHLMNQISKAFYKSSEYDWREYKYQNAEEYRRAIKKEEK